MDLWWTFICLWGGGGGGFFRTHPLATALLTFSPEYSNQVNYFPCRVREAVSLLSLLQGSAQLLKDILSVAANSRDEQNMVEAVKALGEVNVHTLSPAQAVQILNQRIYTV